MRYIILKELLPSLKGTPNYDESMNFIQKCSCIEDDEMFVYDTLEEAETKKVEIYYHQLQLQEVHLINLLLLMD